MDNKRSRFSFIAIETRSLSAVETVGAGGSRAAPSDEALDGAALDLAVGLAQGLLVGLRASPRGLVCVLEYPSPANLYAPSRLWSHGGPIIEDEHIYTLFDETVGHWRAKLLHAPRHGGHEVSWGRGSTPLLAAMRAFVASRKDS